MEWLEDENKRRKRNKWATNWKDMGLTLNFL